VLSLCAVASVQQEKLQTIGKFGRKRKEEP